MGQDKNEGRRLTHIAMNLLAENGGRMGRSELLFALEPYVEPPERRKDKNDKGRKKWEMQLSSYSSGYVKKGYLEKGKSSWSLTPEGDVFRKNGFPQAEEDAESDSDKFPDDSELSKQQLSEEQEVDEIRDFIIETADRTGKKLEKIAAALLRGMGYQYAEVRGGPGDGGVDVVAYKDKLGAIPPRLKVQTKHFTKGQKVSAGEIQKLADAVHEGEIGVFIATSVFTKDAEKFAHLHGKHLLLIDIDRLVELWVEHYPNMTVDDQNLIPLKYALDKNAR